MSPPRGPWLGRIYALTVVLGAFLLFQVQPLLSKWILPWFGGGPEVWTTCLLFFQSALFVGYATSHLAERYLPVGPRVAVLVALLQGAAWLLPVGPGEAWKTSAESHPAGRILLLLAVNVGARFRSIGRRGTSLASTPRVRRRCRSPRPPRTP